MNSIKLNKGYTVISIVNFRSRPILMTKLWLNHNWGGQADGLMYEIWCRRMQTFVNWILFETYR